jgi:solute carrier family 35 protein E3
VAGFIGPGLLAVVGNIVGYAIMGKLGPITWQVVGHVKMMLIMVLGLILFPSWQNRLARGRKRSLVITMRGVVLYTVFEVRAKAEEAKKSEMQTILRKDEATQIRLSQSMHHF